MAVAAPGRIMLENANHETPGLVVADITAAENGAGYDLHLGGQIDMHREDAVDSAAALLGAVRNGIGGAALALTVDTNVPREFSAGD